jgi:hypothetical protein
MPGPDRSSEQRNSFAQQVATPVQNLGAAKRAPAQFHQEMASAEQIVFLGFGYHNQNINLLFPKS